MKFIDFKNNLKNFPLFSLSDIRMVAKNFHRHQLNDWQKKGYIRKVIRGNYLFTDREITEPDLFLIANRIYAPSYVSCETALAFYGLIPESVYGIVSVATRKTSTFSTDLGRFSYRTIKPQAFFGYTIMERGSIRFSIAEAEKAVLDYLYLHADLAAEEDIVSLRIDQETFRARIDRPRLMLFCDRFDIRSLRGRLDLLLRNMDHA